MNRSPIRVLLVDDDEDDYLITSGLLSGIEKASYNLDWVSTYEEALKVIGYNRHDVYLIDYRLGAHSGLDLVRKAAQNSCPAPIILLTGQGDSEVDYEAMKAGAMDYLVKGQLDASLLERSIRYAIKRKQAEEALRASEKRFRDIAFSSSDWLWEVDIGGKYTYASEGVEAVLGYKPEELIGRTPFDMMAEGEAKKIKEAFVKIAAQGGNIIDLVNWNIHKDGHLVCLLTNGVPIKANDGKLLGYRGVDKDITERKQAEKQRRKLQEELERAQRMESLGILAGGVAHDLNNILGPMVGYPELIVRQLPEDSPVRKQVGRIGRSAQEAADVIQDLLTLARRGRLEMSPANLNDVIKAYLDSSSFVRLAEEHPDVAVKLELDETIGKVHGSFTHLSKVVMNLILNAFDAMPNGGKLTIRTSRQHIKKLLGGYDKVKHGDYVLLRIHDTGIGIDREDLDKIFEPYFSKKKMGCSGSGLGLSVVYGIVKDHKGYYDIFSAAGEGTEFVLYFPVCQHAVEEELDAVTDLDGNETVLVADDVEEQREIASELLSSLGYRVEAVSSGREAIEFLKCNHVDVVVLDMIMEQDLDGLDTYREIIKLRPGQKAVIVSGFSATDRVNEMQRLGAGPYVKKPYTLQAIGKAVRDELDREPVVART